MAKDPAFLFYSSDFLTGTMLFSINERGQYISLLCVMHQQGRLTMQEMKVVLKGQKPTESVLKKLKCDEEGRYYNERLEKEAEKRKQFTESRKNSLNINNGDPVFIYLLFDPDSGNYKIGSSKYPLMRLTEIIKKRPLVSLFWKSETLTQRIEEKKLHERFKQKKVTHDWFSLNESDLQYITSLFRTEQNNSDRTAYRTENEIDIENDSLVKEEEGSGEETIGLSPSGFFSDTLDKALPLTDMEIGASIEYLRIKSKKVFNQREIVEHWEAFKIKQFSLHDWYNSWEKLLNHFRDSLKLETNNGTGNSRNISEKNEELGTSGKRIRTAKNW